MSRRIDRINKLLTQAVTEAAESGRKGDFSEEFSATWNTLLKIAGLEEEAEVEKKLKISTLTVIGTDTEHTIFGLGNDNKPYVYDNGQWIEHA